MKTMDKILLLVAVFLFIFTVTMIVVFCIYEAIPDTLVDKVFFACAGEGGFMAVIQTAKVICTKETKNDE